MNQKQRPYDGILLSLLDLMSVVSALGFMLCVFIFVRGNYQTSTQILAYLIWFATTMLSVYMMRRGDVWGAYALATATILLTLYELYLGTASWGGATLGLAVLFIVIEYLTSQPKNNLGDGQSTLS